MNMTPSWDLSPYETKIFQALTQEPEVVSTVTDYIASSGTVVDEDTIPAEEMHRCFLNAYETIEEIDDPLFRYVVCLRLLSYYLGEMRRACGIRKQKPKELM